MIKDEDNEEIKDAILSNLRQLKEKADLVMQEDNPDDLVNELPKFVSAADKHDEPFDYFSKKKFFDDIYFKDSRLIKM